MKDTIYRGDAIEAVREYFRTQLAESGGEWNDELQEYVFSKEDKRILTYNKGINTALKALPSAETHEIRTETHGVCSDLISRADAIEEVCDLYRLMSLFSGDGDRKEYCHDKAERLLEKCPSAEPTAEEVWSVAQKVFYSTLTYREAVDYLKEVEEQHERFNQQSGCD